ncbi:LTA synthase family protein [Clostridium thermosuccinogenes]|uniref:LTA synthase family protein n=1 Tax=Clostridium thermosuccinogenes TaxID=84032 RepID=UPI000CCC140E|nr:LTA synthase family protein [Pseudoclostridium thermosuccinogenes]PNT92762.1 hypothetical protein CDQ83_04165 [Pseudoclostridium thermosuccinogenes]
MQNIMHVQNKDKKSVSRPVALAEALYILFFIGAISLKSIYFHITTKITRKPYFTSGNAIMAVSTFGIAVIMAGLVLLVFNKRRKGALIFLNLFLSALLFADTLYYRYYSNPITIPVLYQMGLVSAVQDSITSLIKPKDIIYALDLPFLLMYIVFMRVYFRSAVLKLDIRKKLISSFAVILSGFVIFLACYLKVDRSSFIYDNVNPVKKLGILYFHTFDSKRFLVDHFFVNKVLNSKDRKRLDDFYASRVSESKEYEGIAQGKNLLIVQVEAFQEFVVGKSVNGKEITPNMNKLIQESFYFDNIYYQVAGGNTSDAEFLLNASLYPAKEGAVYFRYPTNSFHTLPKILKEQGYTSYVFHANNPNFWNRMLMYKSLGFDKFISYDDYTIDEFVGWGGWALSDASFFRQSLRKIDTSKPFYGFMITLSSHHPYTYFNENYKEFDAGEYEGTYLGRFLKAINYADKALGMLIDDLKEQGLYENTLIVIFGDHYAIPRDQSAELMKFMNVQYSDFQFRKLQKVPLIIHCPGMTEGVKRSVVGGEIDIMPTLGNLMGFDTSYAMGRDLLNTETGYALLRNGSVITEDYIYLSDLGEAYDINTGEVLDKTVYEDEVKKLQEEMYISDLILQKDAFETYRIQK